MTKPKAPRAVMVLAACFQNFACGGIIFGWAAISSSLLIASQKDGGPELSRNTVHNLFVMATSINFTAPLLLGALLDMYGPRICSALSIFLVTSGFLLFSASSPAWPTHLPAVILIAFGGPGVQSSIIHLSNLYPASKATITSVITGSFNLSFIVFLLFNAVWEKFGWTYNQIFAGYSTVCVVAFMLSIFLWPDQPFSFQEQVLEETKPDQVSMARIGPIRAPSVFKKSSIQRHGAAGGGGAVASSGPRIGPGASMTKGENTALLGGSNTAATSTPTINIKEDGSFWDQLKSSPFLRVTIMLVVASFWANFWIGTIDLQLSDLHYLTTSRQNFMVRLFTAITTAGVLGIPIVGHLMDKYGFVTTAVVTISMGVIYGAGVLAQDGVAPLVMAFIAYALFRTFLFTYFFAYLADQLGFRFFGVLAGVSFLVAGCAGLLQSPLMEWGAGDCHFDKVPGPGCDPGNWRTINFWQLGCILALFVVPILDLRAKRQEERRKEAGLRSDSFSRGGGGAGGGGGGGQRSPYMTASGIRQQQPRYTVGGSLGAVREDVGGRGGGNIV